MKVFIDTNVFIFGLLFTKTNSQVILEKLEQSGGEYEVVVSELVLDEVNRFFRRNYGDREAYAAVKYVETLSRVVLREYIKKECEEYKGKISDKDLDNLATAKYEKADYLISYDRDYLDFNEYITPRQFVKKFGFKGYETEY